VVNLSHLWQTVGMTKKREFPQHREDRKVQKLVERIVQQQALQAKSAQEQDQALPPKKLTSPKFDSSTQALMIT
jgi:hypothetical protein